MTDLDIAKTELYEEQLTLAIVKNGTVLFQAKSHRITGFLDAIEKYGSELEGSSLADRVVGKAIALLCVYAKIREVYASVLSRKAYAVLKQNKISVQWKELVDNVLNVNKNDMCPFEKAATEITDPEKAYNSFKRVRENLKSCK